MRPVCVECQIEMEPLKNGVTVELMTASEGYQKWMADSHRCPGCGHEIVANFGRQALAEHFDAGYHAILADLRYW